jgi:hypothetical protein
MTAERKAEGWRLRFDHFLPAFGAVLQNPMSSGQWQEGMRSCSVQYAVVNNSSSTRRNTE